MPLRLLTRSARSAVPPCRPPIFAMVALKLTINAPRPESVRVRVHLRWRGALPGRVQVNAQKRFNHKSVPTDGFHAPAGRRGPARRPGSPPGALAQRKTPRPRRVAGVVFRRFRRHDALESSSNRPRIVLEPSPNRPASFPPASRKDPASVPHRSHPAHAARRTSVRGLPRRPGLPPSFAGRLLPAQRRCRQPACASISRQSLGRPGGAASSCGRHRRRDVCLALAYSRGKRAGRVSR